MRRTSRKGLCSFESLHFCAPNVINSLYHKHQIGGGCGTNVRGFFHPHLARAVPNLGRGRRDGVWRGDSVLPGVPKTDAPSPRELRDHEATVGGLQRRGRKPGLSSSYEEPPLPALKRGAEAKAGHWWSEADYFGESCLGSLSWAEGDRCLTVSLA